MSENDIKPADRLTGMAAGLALMLSGLLALLPPAVYFLLEYQNHAAVLEAETRANSFIISRMISASPGKWKREKARLERFLSLHTDKTVKDRRRILDAEGSVIAEHGGKLPPPLLSRASDLSVSGKTVGVIEISRSLRPVMGKTILVGLIGLGVSSLMFVLLRAFPLRALSGTLQSLSDERERAHAILDNIPDIAWLKDRDGRFIAVNEPFGRVCGVRPADLCGKTDLDIWPVELAEQYRADDREVMETGKRKQVVEPLLDKDGNSIWMETVRMPIHNDQGEVIGSTGIARDITERKKMEERLEHDASYDPLTDLPNRSLFIDRVKAAIAQAERHKGHTFAVLFMDLDRFKIVNDSRGHMAGDQLLIEVSRRLRKCVRPYDTIARMGGDEFAVLLADVWNVGDAVRTAERLQNEMGLPVQLGNDEVFISASIGIAVSKGDYKRPDDILRDADSAMYQAKALGKNCHVVFDETLHAQATRHLQMQYDLMRAMNNGELSLNYQPIFSAGREIAGFEALLRWKDQDGLNIPLERFLPVAEDTGMIIPIGAWVLGEACSRMRQWRDRCPERRTLAVSVNISPKQLRTDLAETAGRILKETGLDPVGLKVEITENALMQDPETASRVIEEIRRLDIGIQMDDFGTGYSSLSHLHRFPFDSLKIDRSLIADISENEDSLGIVRSIISMAKVRNMDVIAEGVETEAQLDILKALECSHFQGNLFSRPLSEAEVDALLEGQAPPAGTEAL